ncbi:MAG TPA: zinc ribbon domain-containing protein [Pyrinomonadaceae bacterium]|nr:zinc ribbon domain-containing protein [Pyrinomonadaceae bacterium]
MFCPKCATQNLDGASFCRTCGANISLVPQALTGQITKPAEEVDEGGRRHGKELTLEQAFKNVGMGIAFLLISIVLSRSGQGWWFWFLIPTFIFMATGVAQCIRLRQKDKRESLQAPPVGRAFPDRFQAEMPARPTDELMAPVPSVTEGTTRHLGVEAPTRHLDANERK